MSISLFKGGDNDFIPGPGPEIDDINTMHRYRDAIVEEHGNPYERLMFGAYVLFPLSGGEEAIEKYKKHVFYKSIENVNIGGLSFLPSSTELVEELLEELINESVDTANERAVFPSGFSKMAFFYKQYAKLSAEE